MSNLATTSVPSPLCPPRTAAARRTIAVDERRIQFAPTLWTDKDGNPRANDAQVQQVWFPGVHTDCGGGYEESGIQDLTFAWMVSQLEGMLYFNEDYVKQKASDMATMTHDESKEETLVIAVNSSDVAHKSNTLTATNRTNTVSMADSRFLTLAPQGKDLDPND